MRVLCRRKNTVMHLGDEVNYPVDWTALWRKLTKFISFAISIPLTFVIVINFFKTGFSLDKTFEHIAIWQLPIFFLAIVTFSAVFGFLIAISFKFAHITTEDGKLIGRNYWFLKNSVPLNAITKLYPFSNNGIDAIVASAGKHGKVYISTHTVDLDELIAFIESEMKASRNA